MNRASELRIIVVQLLVFAVGSFACAATQQPKTRVVLYEAFGFAVNVPQASVKQAIPVQEPAKLCEAFRYGNLVYLVKVTAVPEEMLPATAIEKTLQSLTSPEGAMAGARRWEIEIGDLLFKGLAGSYAVQEGQPEAQVLKSVLRDREAYCCMAMAALADRFSPIVELSVVGPASRAREIDDLARFFVYKFSKVAPKLVPTTTAPTSTARPGTSGEARRTLKKGDIELIGRIEYIDASNKTLILIVDRIRMPNTGYIALDPPRRKTIYLRSPLPHTISADAQVRVIGFNSGVGKPMTADLIEPL